MRPSEFLRDQFRIFRLWILERTPAAGAAQRGASSPPGVGVRCLDRHARRDWACENASERDWAQFKTALRHDHDLFLAEESGRVIGWAWIGYECVYLPPLGREIRLPQHTAYLYEAYVRPEARGRGIGQALVAARCQQAEQRGARRLLTHVVDGNVASKRALEAHGFRVVGRTHFLRALAVRVWTRDPLPPSLPATAA
jgi:ribosomal protein S18 acetylase RimI-like enzyme